MFCYFNCALQTIVIIVCVNLKSISFYNSVVSAIGFDQEASLFLNIKPLLWHLGSIQILSNIKYYLILSCQQALEKFIILFLVTWNAKMYIQCKYTILFKIFSVCIYHWGIDKHKHIGTLTDVVFGTLQVHAQRCIKEQPSMTYSIYQRLERLSRVPLRGRFVISGSLSSPLQMSHLQDKGEETLRQLARQLGG